MQRAFSVVVAIALLAVSGCEGSGHRQSTARSSTTTVTSFPMATTTLVPRSTTTTDPIYPTPLTVETDRSETKPGETVTFRVSGCPAAPQILIQLAGSAGSAATRNSDGSFSVPWPVPESAEGTFTVAALCGQRLARSNPLSIKVRSDNFVDFPNTVRVGEAVHLSGSCPYGGGYVQLALYFEAAGVQPSYVGASPDNAGLVNANVTITAPPGRYEVHPRCIEERTPTLKSFRSFAVTVLPASSR